MQRKLVFTFLLITIFIAGSGQNQEKIDSLFEIINSNNKDTLRIDAYIEIANLYRRTNYDSSLILFQKALKLNDNTSKKLRSNEKAYSKLTKQKSTIYRKIGSLYRSKANYDSAIYNTSEALRIAQLINNNDLISKSFNSLGVVYYIQGNYERAIEYYLKSLKINESIGNKLGQLTSFGNIGVVHYRQGNYDIALNYYLRSLDLAIEIGHKSHMSNNFSNIANIYGKKGKKDSSLIYYHKSLDIDIELGNKTGISSCYNNIGNLYQINGDYKKALEFYTLTIKLKLELGDKYGLSRTYTNLSEIHRLLADSILYRNNKEIWNQHLDSAILLGNKAFDIAEKIGSISTQEYAAESLQKAYKEKGLFKEANKFAEILLDTKDSLFSKNKTEALTEMEAKYHSEKKQQEIEKQKLIIAKEKALLKKRDFQRNSFIGAFIVSLIIAVYIFRLNYRHKKTNILLNEKNEEIKAQSEELAKLSIVASETDNAVIIMDTSGNIEWVNDGYTRIYGYSLESLIEEKGINVIHVSDNKDILQIIENCKNTKSSITYQTLSLTKDNIKIWTQTTINPVIDANGDVEKFIAIDSDISKLKEAEEEVLKQSKELELKNIELEKLSIVASETDNTVIIADKCGRIEWVNEAFTRIMGYTLEEFKELRGTTLKEISNNQSIGEYLNSCIKGKRPVVYVSQNTTRDDIIVWMQTTLTPVIVNNEVDKLVAIDTNITRLKLAEEEIESQRDEIEAQRDHIAESKREIQSSIIYAKRIQNAMLSPLNIIEENFRESFVLYMPRDIVSGDFYWCAKIQNFVIFAVADCTGHGVPGALMSMLGLAYLNEIANSYNVFQANAILNQLREKVKNSFHKIGKEGEATDGMDIALCLYDLETKKLQYSGANNSIYILRNSELIEVSPDKMPIGVYLHEYQSFTNNEIQLFDNDILYLFSDGYADQFGGSKNKKYMLWRFRKSLIHLYDTSLNKQKELLIREHNDWKGNNDQVDDILVMGIKI